MHLIGPDPSRGTPQGMAGQIRTAVPFPAYKDERRPGPTRRGFCRQNLRRDIQI